MYQDKNEQRLPSRVEPGLSTSPILSGDEITFEGRSTMNNDAIQEDVLHELSCDPRMTSSHIAVTVKEAVVALSGFVPNYWEKLEAEKAVKPVRGLRGVANDINITLSSKRTDPEVARSAVHELASHVGIPSTEIKATMENGWLTLGGECRLAISESTR